MGKKAYEIEVRRNLVLELWNHGKMRKEIASELSINPFLVANDIKFMKQKGATVRLAKIGRIASAEDRRKKLLDLLNQGKKLNEIASILHISQILVNVDVHRLRKMGLVPKSYKASAIAARREQIQNLWASHSASQIATMLNVSHSLVNKDINHLRKQGIRLRYKKRRKKTVADSS